MSTSKRRSGRRRVRAAGSHPTGQAPAALYATTLPGLEVVLAEELADKWANPDVEVRGRTVVFRRPSPLHLPLALLACDAVCLLVREAHGDFAGHNGLGALCGKLARTQFDRSLELLAQAGRPTPRTLAVAADVAGACGFMFFDVKRQATPVLANRLGLSASDEHPEVVVHVQCLPHIVRVGIRLPLVSWRPPSARATELPRSLVGSLVRLADPRQPVTLCDPDCGPGDVLLAWEKATGARHAVGLDFGRRSRQQSGAARWLVQASTRRWPIADDRLSRVVSALPRVRSPAEFAKLLGETDRCLAPGGRAVFSIPADEVFHSAIEARPRLVLARDVKFRRERKPRRIIVLTRDGPPNSHRTPMTAGDRARATSGLGGIKSRRRSPPRTRRPPPPRRSRGPKPGRP